MRRGPGLVLFGLTAALAAQASGAPTPPADPFAPLAALPTLPPEHHGLEILVVDAQGKPVAEAMLIRIDSNAADYLEVRRAAEASYPGDEPRILAARAQRGTRYAIDDRGLARVPSDMTGRLIAVHDGLVASVVRSLAGAGAPRQKRLELRLLPPTTTRVTVLTADGKPAAAVPLRILDAPNALPFPDCCTGADGTITLRLLPRPATAFVECDLPLTTRPSGKFADAGKDGLTLRLPPCGSVYAMFAGELVPGARIRWQLLDRDGNQVGEVMGERTIVFPWVDAGMAGKLRCLLEQRPLGVAEVPAVVADGKTEVAVARDPALRSFALQVIGPDGAPAAKSQVQVQWTHARGGTSDWAITNPEGWVELWLPDGVDEGIQLRVDARAGSWSAPLIGWAAIEIGKLAAARTVHGRLALVAPEEAVRGKVVDAAGKPVADVQIRVDVGSRHVVGTDAAGAFVVAVPAPVPAVITLSLADDAWFPADPNASFEFAKGQRDAQIVVRAAARVRMGVRDLPAGVRNDFDFEVQPVEGGPPVRVAWDPGQQEMRMPAGNWHFLVKLGDQEVHRLENLRADAGVETHDPRFMDFDWRVFASLVTVRVEDKDGRPENDCTVWHRYRNYGTGSGPEQGVVHLLVEKEGGAIAVEPEDKGHATIELGVVTGEHTVRIGGGPQLVVELSKPLVLRPGAALTLRVGEDHDGVAFDGEGRARVLLPKAGTFELHLGVRIDTHTNVLSWSRTVDVGAAGDTLKIELTSELQKMIDDQAR